MLSNPLISIVVPSYNQGSFLEQNLKSIICQSYKSFEIILLDGGSTDTSELIINKYRKHLGYVRQEKDSGHYAAINEGFSLARGEVFMWLNSDDMLHPGALHLIARAFKQFGSDAGLFTGLPCTWDEAGQLTSININPPTWGSDYFLQMNLETDSFMQQESTFFTRSLWEEVGGLSHLQYPYAADFDLWLRMSAQSDIISLPYLIGGFRIHSHQRSHQYQRYCLEAQSSRTAFSNTDIKLRAQGLSAPSHDNPSSNTRESNNDLATGDEGITLYTSISPRNTIVQQDSIRNWMINGFDVVSLNSGQEIEAISASFNKVRFRQTEATLEKEYGKPYVSLVALINECADSGQCSGIINSDVRFVAQASAESVLANTLLAEESRDTIYLCSRIEISNLCNQLDFEKAGRGLPAISSGSVYTYGFDAVFARREVWQKLRTLIDPNTSYGLGVPWWDYYLPLMASSAGIRLCNIYPAIISHFYHHAQYSEEIWVRVGNALASEILPYSSSSKEGRACNQSTRLKDQFAYTKTDLESLSRELIKFIHLSANDFNLGQSVTGPNPRLWDLKKSSSSHSDGLHWMTQSPSTFHRNYHG